MRRILGGLSVAMLLVGAAGCGSSDDGEPVASNAPAAGATTAPAAPGGESSGAPGGMPGAASTSGGPPGGMPGPGSSSGGPPGGMPGPGGYGTPPGGAPGMMQGGVPGGMPGPASTSGGPPGGMPGPGGSYGTPPGGLGAGPGAPGMMPAPPGGVPPMGTSGVPGGGLSGSIASPGGETSGALGGGLGDSSTAVAPGEGVAGGALPPLASSGAMPPGSIPPGAMPPGAMPPGTYGAGASVPGGMPPGAGAFSGSVPPGGIPGGVPGGSIPPGVPGGSFGEGSVPGIPGAGIPGGPAVAPTTYDGLAKQAFQQGRERDGIHYMQAWALTSDDGASEVLSAIQWVNGLKRPTMAVRWGVGVQVSMPPRFSGDVKPIGSTQQFGGGRGRPGGGGPGSGGEVGPPGGAPGGAFGSGGMEGGAGGAGAGAGAVAQFAGEFGRGVIEQFQSRVSGGKFGKVLQDAASGGLAGGAAGGAGPGGFGPPGIPGGSGGEGAIAGFGPPGGGAGMAPPGMRPPGGGGIGAAGAGGPTMLSTGLTMLGVTHGTTDKDLREKALKEHVDVLAVFKVKVSVNRAGLVNNDAEIVLVDPAKGKELFSTGTLNNMKVQKDRESNKDDAVAKEIAKLFEFVDKELTVTEMPAAITSEMVRANRVEKQLLTTTIEDPLSVLTELRFYQRAKLLSDADTASSIAKVAGTEAAKTLLEGKEEDRKKVVEKWLPK